VWTILPLGANDLLEGGGTVITDGTILNSGLVFGTINSSQEISEALIDSSLSYIRAVRHELLLFIADKA
jgi:hypothetical protein